MKLKTIHATQGYFCLSFSTQLNRTHATYATECNSCNFSRANHAHVTVHCDKARKRCRCEVGCWSVFFDKYILQFGQICLLIHFKRNKDTGVRLETRVTDRTVPWLPSTTSSQLPQGFVLCVTLICIFHHILLCIVLPAVALYNITLCILLYRCAMYSVSVIPNHILLLYFVCLRICATKLVQWGPFEESTFTHLTFSASESKMYPFTCEQFISCVSFLKVIAV